MQYHCQLQGFIYHLLNGSKYKNIHDKKGYKFFCFSNVFPVSKNIINGDVRNLSISSPDSNFIFFLENSLKNFSGKNCILVSISFQKIHVFPYVHILCLTI